MQNDVQRMMHDALAYDMGLCVESLFVLHASYLHLLSHMQYIRYTLCGRERPLCSCMRCITYFILELFYLIHYAAGDILSHFRVPRRLRRAAAWVYTLYFISRRLRRAAAWPVQVHCRIYLYRVLITACVMLGTFDCILYTSIIANVYLILIPIYTNFQSSMLFSILFLLSVLLVVHYTHLALCSILYE